ncbi:MAG: acyl-CoA dehydrogenase N-terminal domain-containing protein, partial [Pseudomonadota bacterium]
MPSYKAPVRDMQFLLHEVLGYEDLTKYDAFSEIDRDLTDAV